MREGEPNAPVVRAPALLIADQKKTHGRYEAPSAETIREAARRAHGPAEVLVDVRVDSIP